MWYDEEDDYAFRLPSLLRYNSFSRRWECICPRYQSEGRCVHLFHYRRTDEIKPLEKYL